MGELRHTVNKWHTYAELIQVMKELGMRQVMFKLNTQGPGDEHLGWGGGGLCLAHWFSLPEDSS